MREDLFDNLIERREYFRHLQKGIKRTMLNNSIPYNYTVDIVRQGEEGVKNGRPAIEIQEGEEEQIRLPQRIKEGAKGERVVK